MSNRIHLGASGILSHRGCVLLGKRSDDDTSLPGQWCSPGGGVEFGESIDSAIVREFREETGLRVSILPDFACVEERLVSDHKHTVLVFKHVTFANGQLQRPAALDGFSEVAWFNKEETLSIKVTELTRRALDKFFIV